MLKARRWLFVDADNGVRSTTAEHIARMMGYEADSCCSWLPEMQTPRTTMKILDSRRVLWASVIVCMEQSDKEAVKSFGSLSADKLIYCLDIPNKWDKYCDEKLMEMLRNKVDPIVCTLPQHTNKVAA